MVNEYVTPENMLITPFAQLFAQTLWQMVSNAVLVVLSGLVFGSLLG